MKGIVFDIQRYSIHDGPGIRTVVFLKGCPLRCIWCCNPESQSLSPETEFRYQKCIGCGLCVKSCPNKAVNHDLKAVAEKIAREKCDCCGKCADVCPSKALRIVGKNMSVEEVLEQVEKDRAYYRRSGGGVTLSGGEPFLQADFATEILRCCYDRNIHTAVETTGFVDWEIVEKATPYIGTFLFDLKQTDDNRHRELTGVSNKKILENLCKLSKEENDVILRIPFIPGINADINTAEQLLDILEKTNIKEIHLMPFHQLGKDKYDRLGRAYSLKDRKSLMETEEGKQLIETTKKIIENEGYRVQIGG